jgi:hypothetical protein
LVVRGGILRDPERIRNKVLEAIEDGDGPVLSIWCAEAQLGESREELLLRICREADFPYRKVQVGTFGRMRHAVPDVYQESSSGEPDSHYHVSFTGDVALSQVEAFIAALDEPEPNPTGGKP